MSGIGVGVGVFKGSGVGPPLGSLKGVPMLFERLANGVHDGLGLTEGVGVGACARHTAVSAQRRAQIIVALRFIHSHNEHSSYRTIRTSFERILVLAEDTGRPHR